MTAKQQTHICDFREQITLITETLNMIFATNASKKWIRIALVILPMLAKIFDKICSLNADNTTDI